MKSAVLSFVALSVCSLAVAQKNTAVDPVSYSNVTITDAFWKPRIEKISSATLPACIYQTEEKTARIRNFEIVAGTRKGEFEGIFYDDSDVYKALEAIAYALKSNPDAKLEAKADEWIDKIAAAQQPDGYINTWYTLKNPEGRWSDMSMHEDYNGGHLIEAAVAYFKTTGKRKLLDVAIRFADHFDSLFGPGKRHWVTGHQELELALVKLYEVTNEKRYLNLANWLLEERGHRYAKGYTWSDWRDTAYAQDVLPVKLQKEITGHAVRAMYMYTGAADVAAITGDQGYIDAMKAVWEDVVHRNYYITGGIGASGRNEGFAVDYDLPNASAYCETCASVGMVFWNQRMNKLSGNAKYIDVLERSLYNSALAGLALSGDRFFYGNPLASDGNHHRREWFGTACCPANIARLTASVGDYIYATSDDGLWVNLFIGSSTEMVLGKKRVAIAQSGNYPWDGNVSISVSPASKARFKLRVRIPGWLTNDPVPGGLYKFANDSNIKAVITVNGKSYDYRMVDGYAVIDRDWRKGDVVNVNLPMEIRELVADERVLQDRGRVALQRGPLVYCVEGVDNGGNAWNFIVPESTSYSAKRDNILDGVVSIEFTAPAIVIGENGMIIETRNQTLKAIPYYAWCNRGQNPMQVWLPRKFNNIKVNPEGR